MNTMSCDQSHYSEAGSVTLVCDPVRALMNTIACDQSVKAALGNLGLLTAGDVCQEAWFGAHKKSAHNYSPIKYSLRQRVAAETFYDSWMSNIISPQLQYERTIHFLLCLLNYHDVS